MTTLMVVAVPWSVAVTVLAGSIYAESVVRRRRARKRRAELRRRLVVIDGGGAPVIQLRSAQVRHG